MGLFSRRRDQPKSAEELLADYHASEAARMGTPAPPRPSSARPVSAVPPAQTAPAGYRAASATPGRSAAPASAASSGPASASPGSEFTVEDMFHITGRGIVVTGRVERGVLRVGDEVSIVREGRIVGPTRILAIEAFRRTLTEATPGTMVGLQLNGRPDVARGDAIRSR